MGSGIITAEELVQQPPEHIIEVVSQSADFEALTGVGGSPHVGDIGAPGVVVPEAATAGQDDRYLIRLCGVEIPSGYGVVIRGLRQAITLKACAIISDATETESATNRVFELDQTSPFWTFPDGNVSWHLMHMTGLNSPRGFDPAQPPGQTPQLRGTAMDSALVYSPAALPLYTPLGAGLPPGVPVANLGTFRDLRYFWNQVNWTLSIPVWGPGQLLFFASVKQTDPATRGAYPAAPNSIRAEDQFARDFSDAVYGRVAGALAVEMFPCGGKPR